MIADATIPDSCLRKQLPSHLYLAPENGVPVMSSTTQPAKRDRGELAARVDDLTCWRS